jgi:predicted PurR-regulated permease PerM
MKREYFFITLFLTIVAIFFYLFYRLMVPFFTPIAWAGILVIVFYPLYKWLYSKLRLKWLASLLACILISLIIIGPAIYLLASLVGEAADLVQYLNEEYQSGRLNKYLSLNIPFINAIKDKLSDYPQLANLDIQSIIKDTVSTITKAMGSQTTKVIANISKTFFYFVLMLFSMFFFFRDGDRIVAFLKRITPLKDEQINVMYDHLLQVIEGIMYGGVIIAFIQGALCGITFAAVGIPSPVFWGAVMTFLAFLPVVGPFLVYIPAAIILLLGGSIVEGVVVIIAGTAISQIDNFLRPQLFSGKTSMHTLLLFFSIMGGVAMFGLLGIVLGPLITAVFLSLLKVYEVSLGQEKSEPVLSRES